MTGGLRPRRRRELPVEALRPAHSVPRLRTRGRLRLVRQPVLRKAGSPLVALALAVSAHAALAWWGLEGFGRSAAPLAVRDMPGAALAVSLDLRGERPATSPRRVIPEPLERPAPPPEPEPDVPVDGLAEPAAANPERALATPAPEPRGWGPGAWSVEAAGPPAGSLVAEAVVPAASPDDLVARADDAAVARGPEAEPPLDAPTDAPAETPPEPRADEGGVASPAGQTTRPEPFADNPSPRYPAAARRRGWEGLVVVVVRVDAEGAVLRGEVARSSGRNVLDQAALTAVLDWRFEPARDGLGQAVPGEREVSVRFRLGPGA